MYISGATSPRQFSFKALHPKDGIPTENVMMTMLRSGEQLPLNAKNVNNKESLFQSLIDNNYTRIVSYLYAKGYEFSEVINKPNQNGQLPLDTVRSDEMRILLKRIGAKSAKSVQIITPDSVIQDDAKTIAAKQYMTQPVMEKVAESAAKSENNQETASFFDAFEEVEESAETKAVAKVEETSLQHSAQEVTDADRQLNSEKIKVEKPKPKELDISGLKDFRRLEITENDVLSIDDLIGQTAVKDELKTNVVAPLKDEAVSNKLKENKIDLPNGILIEGNGGEITVIKALSNEAEIPVIIMENPQELPQMLTAIEARYKKTGKKTAILAQGFDKYFPEGNQNNVQANAFRNSLKGIKNKGALFIATTPDKSLIGCDFMKSGIIDKVLEVVKPDEADRTEFFKRHFDGKEVFNNMANDETISELVMLTDNRSYADILRVLDETARTATANGKNADMEEFKAQLKDFSDELGIVPITEENRTASYDTPEFKRVPIEKGEMMSLDELGGMPEAKKRLRELYVEPMKNLDELTEIFGADAIPDGAIFYGAPGNGKTLTGRVLARELGLPYYETRLSDFGTALVHESGKAFKKLADQLDRKFKETGERSVWFLDEFDSIGASRNGNGQGDKELTDALLQEFTNPQQRGFILIAATNNLDDVDAALKRRGRLGNWIEFKNPNQEEREDTIKKILLKHEFTKEFADNNELISNIAKELDGFSMSSIANILKDAKRDFYLNKTDFETAVKKALDINSKREMGEFCGKAGLTQHKYEDWNYKSLDELGGMSDVIRQLKEYVVDAWNPEIREALKANKRMPSGGFILEGPPGGGKTTVIETLAREMDIPLYKMDYNQEGNEYIHQVAKHVQEIFDKLALESKIIKKPVMLFFDEAEKFFPRYAERHQIEEVNTYKELMNSAASKGIILAGATNHIDLVNQEIIGNPRRMGTVIHCGEPNLEDRKDILKRLLTGLPIITEDFTEENIEDIAVSTAGFSIGQLSDAVDKIIVQAVKRKENLTPQKIIQEFRLNIVPLHIK